MPSLITRVRQACSAFMSNETGEMAPGTSAGALAVVGCYILEIDSGATSILSEPQDPEKLAKKHIGFDRSTQSVFQASNDIEELEILAALLACRQQKSGPETRHCLRLLQSDFEGLPVTLKHTPKEG